MTEKVEYARFTYKFSLGGSVQIFYKRFYQVDIILCFGNSILMMLDTVSEILYRPSHGTIWKYATLVKLSR
jgi:hypothetical protein